MLDHLLLYVLLAPLACGVGVGLLVHFAGRDRWPLWGGLAFAAALAVALALSPNYALVLPPRIADDGLPLAAAAFALSALLRIPGPGSGFGRLWRDALVCLPAAAALAWLTAAPVRAFYGWGPLAFAAVLTAAAVAGGFSAALHRAMARKHPAPGALAAWLVMGLGASLSLKFGHTVKGAEFGGVFCGVLGPVFLLALARGRARSAEAFAAPVAGALYAALLYGLLQADLIWIAAALLVLLAPAAGLLQLRSRSVWTLVGALGFVTLLPVAAAVFMAFMKAAAGEGSGGGYGD